MNVDTDQVVPARFLRMPRASGYENYLFRDLRDANPDFVLDRPAYRGARILVAADNFGCGSSRESAVWALAGFGLRAWIAPSFGDIFFENSFKNGVLAIVLPGDRVAAIRALLAKTPGAELTIDLPSQTLRSARRSRRALRGGPVPQGMPARRHRRDRAHASIRKGNRRLRGAAMRGVALAGNSSVPS